jgi:hypothetical protein
VLLEWGKKVSKKYISKELSEQIHKRAESFLTWLKTAEEESEEDSDEDVQLEFDERAKISTIKEKVTFLLPVSKQRGKVSLKTDCHCQAHSGLSAIIIQIPVGAK